MGITSNSPSSGVHEIIPFDISNFEYGQGVKLLDHSLLKEVCQRSTINDCDPLEAEYTALQETMDRRFDPWLEPRTSSSDMNYLNASKSARGRKVSRVSLNEDDRWEMVCRRM